MPKFVDIKPGLVALSENISGVRLFETVQIQHTRYILAYRTWVTVGLLVRVVVRPSVRLSSVTDVLWLSVGA